MEQDIHNFLLCGTHERNPDAIVIASVNYTTEMINLISIPRDIYYKGRKINSYYQSFGADRFTSVLSDITGLNIHRYFFIDMYAFIDVINIIGGIEVTLKNDLVDPTYAVRDNGVWSTLYYRKGTHHLSGVEALRVARARHFMPVFSRDNRQLKILSASKKKLEQISLSDVNRIYDIFRSVLNYMETDMSIVESLALFRRIINIDSISHHVVSTENILYQTYSNLLHMGITEEEADPSVFRGAWILVPKNNDWESLSEYINSIIWSSN